MSQVKLIFQHLKSLLSTSKSISIVTLVVAATVYLWKKSKRTNKTNPSPSIQKSKKGTVSMAFFRHLWILIKIVVPSWKSREMFYLCSLSVLLVARTMLSISLSDLKGRIVKNIVTRRGAKFAESVSII